MINRVIHLRHVRLMITLSYYGKFNLSNCKVESRDAKVLGDRERGYRRGDNKHQEVHDDEDFTGGHGHYPRRSLEIMQESLELNQHRLREERK